jgi:hypothetical protein
MSSSVTDTDKGYAKFLKAVQKLATGKHVVVGVTSTKRRGGITLAQIAAVHEFRSPAANIPERSYLRSTFDRKAASYTGTLAIGLGKAVLGLTTGEAVLEELGTQMTRDVVATIDAGVKPALAASTVARKGSSKPLVETGELRAAIKHEIRGGS